MDVNINSIHFTADKKLKQLIQTKVKKLTTFHDGLLSIDVNLKVDKSDKKENKIAEVKLFIRGGDLFAKKQAKTFEEAVDECLDATRRQLLKHKEKERKV
ncbi:MAG: ribosome-associated translation inhibitor RaiA [Bacteroidales bacterium]|nr:ribosome-associated translation inhibitor RaiA [Bacteroidales bacterium]RLD39610.1 MAG: ribosome-associated translation inhibitor RaiA [Bacteroidota bacterium]